MKRLLCLLLGIVLAFSLAACSKANENPNENDTPSQSVTNPEDNQNQNDNQTTDDTENPDENPEDEEPKPEMIEGREVIDSSLVMTEGLYLFGRSYKLSKQLCMDNASTGFEVSFYGTELKVSAVCGANTLYARAFVDSDEEGTLLPFSGNKDYTLASGLDEGVHTVRLIKSTSSQNGKISIKTLKTDGKFLKAEQKSPVKIEFVGDSITVGAGLFGKGAASCAVDNSDATKSYAYLTCQALQADCSMVATEGICVKLKKNPYLPLNMMEMYTQLSSVTTNAYDFKETYDIVVVALGTNDGFYMSSDYGMNELSQDYKELLQLIRSKNADAKIVCIYGMMGSNNNVKRGIKAAITGMKDSNITYLDMPASTEGASAHPSLLGAQIQAETLTAYLRELLLPNGDAA